MDSFRVYLPSNASMDIFPDNKPSDFKVEMKSPLILDGKWEVGVENVCYDSDIANSNENEEITVTARAYKAVSMNELFNYPYVLTKDGRWNYDWIQLESDYYGDSDMPKIRDTLNSGNGLIMKDKRKKVYKFYLTHRYSKLWYAFKSYSSGFVMRCNGDLLKHMGFGHSEHTNTGIANVQKVDFTGRINKSNYKFKMFDSNVVECEERVILKKHNEKGLSITALVNRWNKTIGKKYGEMAENKKGKFNIKKQNDKLTLYFSHSIFHIIRHYQPLIGAGIFWASHAYWFTEEDNYTEWYVDIYGDRIKTIREHEREIKTVFVFPVRKYSTVEELTRKMNSHIEGAVKENLGNNYDVNRYHISFEIINQKTVLKLGTEMKVHLSKRFASLFGFASQTFDKEVTVSLESAMTLDKREQLLYIQSDLINPISFGDNKEYILRGFIHDKDKNYGIMEKLFEPILYHPVVKQHISLIHLSITNGLHEHIHFRDTKTLITLIFRRVK